MPLLRRTRIYAYSPALLTQVVDRLRTLRLCRLGDNGSRRVGWHAPRTSPADAKPLAGSVQRDAVRQARRRRSRPAASIRGQHGRVTAGSTVPVGVRERTLLDRLLAAVPVAGIVLLVLTFYGVEAWTRKTPWLFTDELEWTQISRAIASTGHAARRGEPVFFKSFYAYLIAPFWW